MASRPGLGADTDNETNNDADPGADADADNDTDAHADVWDSVTKATTLTTIFHHGPLWAMHQGQALYTTVRTQY